MRRSSGSVAPGLTGAVVCALNWADRCLAVILGAVLVAAEATCTQQRAVLAGAGVRVSAGQ